MAKYNLLHLQHVKHHVSAILSQLEVLKLPVEHHV